MWQRVERLADTLNGAARCLRGRAHLVWYSDHRRYGVRQQLRTTFGRDVNRAVHLRERGMHDREHGRRSKFFADLYSYR